MELAASLAVGHQHPCPIQQHLDQMVDVAPVSEALLVAKMVNSVDVAHCMAIVARPLLSEYYGVIGLDLAHGLLAVLKLRDVKADATLQVQSRSHLPPVESLS